MELQEKQLSFLKTVRQKQVMSKKLVTFVFLIIGIEIIVFLYSSHLSASDTIHYQLAARYSARISFFIIVAILLWTGWSGLNTIYQDEKSRKYFVQLILLFSINHIIHLYFLSMNFWLNNLHFIQFRNMFGALVYIALIAAPIYLWNRTKMSRKLYKALYLFLSTVTALFFLSYLGRLSKVLPVPSSKLFFIGSLITIGSLVLLNGYRMFVESRANKRPL